MLGNGQGAANLLAHQYRADLLSKGRAAATVNRRLAALRSVTKLANTLGTVNWKLEVPFRKLAYQPHIIIVCTRVGMNS